MAVPLLGLFSSHVLPHSPATIATSRGCSDQRARTLDAMSACAQEHSFYALTSLCAVARSRVLSSLQLGAVLTVPWRCIGPASSCTVILSAENGLAPGVSMQVAVDSLHELLRDVQWISLFWHGLLWSSPSLLRGLLARLSVQLYSSLSLGSFVALGFQRVYGMALFGLGLRPGNTIGFNEWLLLSCVFASCSSCSLALVVTAAAGWGKKRGGQRSSC